VTGYHPEFSNAAICQLKESPMLKVIIVIVMIAVVLSLFSGLIFLIKDEGKTQRVLNSLIVRVSLSVLLLVLILFSLWQGDLSMNPTP
jgi:NADH:ubiquinone oxidoreductase subunit 6 (subunit J)